MALETNNGNSSLDIGLPIPTAAKVSYQPNIIPWHALLVFRTHENDLIFWDPHKSYDKHGNSLLSLTYFLSNYQNIFFYRGSTCCNWNKEGLVCFNGNESYPRK